MYSRIIALQKKLRESPCDALLVACAVNQRYLLEYPACDAWLLVTVKTAYYLTDSRYAEEAKAGLKGVQVHIVKENLYQALGHIVKAKKIKSLGYDSHELTVFAFNKIKAALPAGCRLVIQEGLVEQFRAIKDTKEIDAIRQALRIHKQALVYLRRIIRPGVSEKDIALKLELFIKKKGCGNAFDPIVASGPNSACPHARITNRKVRSNDVVLVDMGIDYQGYKSDLTRMFFFGRIPKPLRDIYRHVRQAQAVGMKKIQAGLPAADIDREVRKYFRKHQLERCFTHALGHGVGLDVHEYPRLSRKSTATLREGMVVTVEPGIYIPGRFGVRIEDMVLVKQQEREILSDDIH